MLHKNVLPLPKRGAAVVNPAEQAALNALSGLFCSVCDAPLSRTNRATNGNIHPHSAYVCCRTAHCPFCGASGKRRCEHLVAYHTSGDWRIAGLPDVFGQSVPEPFPVAADALLDYGDEQKREVFGAAEGLLFTLYGPGFREIKQTQIGGHLLVKALTQPENTQYPGAGVEYHFSRNVVTSAEAVQRALTTGLTEGFARLRTLNPFGSEFVINVIEAPRDISAVAFAPCGTRAVICNGEFGTLYRIHNGEFITQANWNSLTSDRDYVSAAFSPDGLYITLQDRWRHHNRDRLPYYNMDYRSEFRRAETGELLGAIEPPYSKQRDVHDKETDEPRYEFDASREAFLHRGGTYLTVRGRCLRFYRADNLSQDTDPAFAITLRIPVTHIAVSPDGEKFLTAAGRFVILWGVPQGAVVAG